MNNLIIKELYRASLFCKMSYYSSSQLDEIFEKDATYQDIFKIIKNNNLSYYEDAHIKFYIFKYNNTIFIILNSSLIYQYNNKLFKYKDDICMHKGLLEQFYSIEDKLHTNITNLNKNKVIKKIYVIGYYMGGSLAEIAAAILAEKYKNMFLVNCFTFGAQMVGNCAFKRYFKDNVSNNYRVIIGDCQQLTYNNSDALQNCYSYYKLKYETYNKFYNGKYCHISNALQLTDDNLLEIRKPRLNKRSRIFRHFYNTLHIDYPIKDIDDYILKFLSIIRAYKENIARHSKKITEDAADAAEVAPSHSSSGSKTSNDEECSPHLSKNDIAYIDAKLQNITNMLNKILANHKKSYT